MRRSLDQISSVLMKDKLICSGSKETKMKGHRDHVVSV